MNRGIVIFAHNSRDVDYALLSIISGGLAKKNLNLPVSLITDQSTVDWMANSEMIQKAEQVFEKIIVIPRPITDNKRKLCDGTDNKTIPFINVNRVDVYNLSPYDETLLIDSDYFIFTDNLNNYWQYADRVLIGRSINDIVGVERLGYHDRYVSDTGVHLYWATTVMFKKNKYAENFFTILDYVRENYQYFSDLFRFYNNTYRNDIAFSVAQHIISGFETDIDYHLPPIFTTLDKDVLTDVNEQGKLTFLLNVFADEKFALSTVKNIDIHVMNKNSITRHKEQFLNLI